MGAATDPESPSVDVSVATTSREDPTRGFFNKVCFGWMLKHVSAARRGEELNPEVRERCN